MIRYTVLIVGEEGLKISKMSVWVMTQKYKRHGTVYHLLGSGQPTLQRIVRTLYFLNLTIEHSTQYNAINPTIPMCLYISTFTEATSFLRHLDEKE